MARTIDLSMLEKRDNTTVNDMLSVLRSPDTAMADAKKEPSFVLTVAIDDVQRQSSGTG